ncbi:MAG: peroxiredoxin family protein [Nitrospinota bacterium]
MGLTGWKLISASKAGGKDYLKTLGIQKFQDRPQAPPFVLPDVNGNTVRLADFKGKVVLLNFFATWCTPCRWEMPEMERLHQAYKEKGFLVVAISIDRSRGVIPPFVKEMNLTFPVLHDPDLQVARKFGARGLPSTYLIDAQGKVIGSATGPREWFGKEARAYIENLLSKG